VEGGIPSPRHVGGGAHPTSRWAFGPSTASRKAGNASSGLRYALARCHPEAPCRRSVSGRKGWPNSPEGGPRAGALVAEALRQAAMGGEAQVFRSWAEPRSSPEQPGGPTSSEKPPSSTACSKTWRTRRRHDRAAHIRLTSARRMVLNRQLFRYRRGTPTWTDGEQDSNFGPALPQVRAVCAEQAAEVLGPGHPDAAALSVARIQ